MFEQDWVLPGAGFGGTWRTSAVAPQSLLARIPRGLPAAQAAQLAVNPCTALRLLADFETLSAGTLHARMVQVTICS